MKPIFICGHIKTGTSLMASLLDNHPQLSVFPEELFLFSKYSVLKKNKQLDYDQFWDLFFNDIQTKKMFGGKSNGLYGNVDYSNFDAEVFKKKCIEKTLNLKTKDDFIFIIYETILKSFNDINKKNNKRWVEKTPMNEFYFLKWLNRYPNAQFLYMKRDPLEVFSSIKKKRNIENINYNIYSFITKYKTSLFLAGKLCEKYPNNFKIVNLNSLKSNTENTLNDICKFLNIQFSDRLLKPSKMGIIWRGNSMFLENNFDKIIVESYHEERLNIINDQEKTLISKYFFKDNKPLIDINFIKNDFKSFLKVRLPNLWLQKFMKYSK